MAFPTSPTNGQQANINGITYTYSSALTAWTVSTSVSNTFVSINVSANVNSGNVLATGLASVTGNITGGNLSGTNIVGTLTTAAQTNITSVGTLGSLTVTADTTSGNLLTGGAISATGNITGGNILGGANVNATTHTGTTVLVTANVTGGNILTGGLISATGNIAGGNVIATTGLTAGTLSLTGNTISSTDSIITIDPASAGSSGAVFIQGNLSVTGNVTYINSNNVTTNDLTINMANNAATAAAANGGGIEVGPAGAQYASITYNSTGNIWVVSNGANVSGAASITGNVTGGNILTGGLISAAGNISANNATFTSNQTLSYGTANGVIYLNSSKVATSGTALVFDGTNLGIGTSSPLSRLDVRGTVLAIPAAVDQFGFQMFKTGTSTTIAGFYQDTTNNGVLALYNTNAQQSVSLSGATANALTLDASGNFGVGTTTPSTGKFSDASYAFLIQSASTSTGTNIFASNSDNSKFLGLWSGHSGAEPAIGVKTGNAFTFGKWAAINGTGGFTENMRISSDGVLQVGRTGGSAPDGKLQVIASGTGAGAANTKLGFTLIEDDSGNAAGLWLGSMTNENTGVIGSRTASGNIAFQTYNGGWGERVRITYDGSFNITQTPGKYSVDVSGGGTVVANGGTVDFPNASGMLVVNNWNNGAVSIYLCGSGNVQLVSSVTAQVGTFAYNAGIAGYTWTNNSGVTNSFGFFFVRTRPTA